MFVIATYSLLDTIVQNQSALMDLRSLIVPWVPQRIRRIDRYIELCLAGGLNCVAGRKLPASTGVYLASRGGAVHTPAAVMETIFSQRETPMPLHFVNTLGNTAGFYLTQLLQVSGNTLMVSQEHLSFEAALTHAWIDLNQHRIETALIGGFDEVALPFSHQAQRLDTPSATALTEGTHWILLGNSPSPKMDTGNTEEIVMEMPHYLPQLSQLGEWLTLNKKTNIQCGFSPTEEETSFFHKHNLSTSSVVPTGTPHGVFSGAALIALIEHLSRSGGHGVHLMRDAVGGYCVVPVNNKTL